MGAIRESIRAINEKIGEEILLVVVSKTRSDMEILEAYNAGVRDFGENKVQELVSKAKKLPTDIRWHMIGHLQRNKAKQLVEVASLIHSIDSLKLLKELNKEAAKKNLIVDCLLQVKVAEEESKFGMSKEIILEMLSTDKFKECKNVKIRGLMTMASFSSDEEKVRSEFKSAKSFFDELRLSQILENDEFSILSMGMTNDYSSAIEEGSNVVRIGSAIFGPRI